MADVAKKFSGTMPNTLTNLQESESDYTPGTGRQLIITQIVVVNTNATTDYYGKVKIGAVHYLHESKITAQKTFDSGNINLILSAGEKLAVCAEAASAVEYIICGVEVDV